jgi:hypothetical protein
VLYNDLHRRAAHVPNEERQAMETINFQCGNCGNLMGVGAANLGQQVRCPHCQQVVVAPPPSAPPPAEQQPSTVETFPIRPLGEAESIFSPPEESGEDLFGGPSAPRVEMPAEPPAAPVNGPVEGLPPPLPVPFSSTLTFSPPPTEPGTSPHIPAETSGTAVVADQSASWMDSTLPQPESELPPIGLAAIPRTARRPAQGGGGWFIALVFVPLVSYSVLATIALIILWNRLQAVPARPHPLDLEMIPDVEGDNPGAVKNLPKKQSRSVLKSEFVEKLAELEVPPNLRHGLGKTFRIGDLEVKPTHVERKVVKVFVEGFPRPEPCQHESLVLHLHFRNVSADTTFLPMDNYFDRYWKRDARSGPPPLTQLEMGDTRFYGGPARWFPRQRNPNNRNDRQWLEGRKNFYENGLEPGEEMETFVCTDGDDPKVIPAFEKFKGKLLWHVQVRRGLVPVGNRELPAAAVVGIEFTAEDVKKVAPEG